MQESQTITPKEYLTTKGISFKEQSGELITHCLFNDCDTDSKGNEAHLYFNAETGQYDCKKCGAKGNLVTLAKHFGDEMKEIAINQPSLQENAQKSTKFNIELVETCHLALPNHMRQYLNARGITDTVISVYKLGWGEFYGKWWITIPIKDKSGTYQFFKLRQDPSRGSDKMTYPKGNEAQIYGWDTLEENPEKIVICEGELDRLTLLTKKIPAITSTHGAGTFKKEWVKNIEKCQKIYICFDNDEAGRKGAERVVKLAKSKNNQVYIVDLPKEVGEGGDVTDYLIKLQGKTSYLFGKYTREYLSLNENQRIKKMEKPEKETSFHEWQEVIKSNFPDLLFPSEVGLSIIAQILIKEITNPFALVLVDVPSSGKTISINLFSDIDELTYASDKFTPASFVSNAVNVSHDKLAEIDLLPRLQYKMFLIRDLSTLFSKRDDDLNDCLGTLTRVLDGEGLNTDSGVHGQRQYVGEYLFMILAGSTPIPPRVWKMMGNLGSRLFFLNMNTREKSEQELANQLTTTAYKEKEKICREATKNFLINLWHKHAGGVEWDRVKDSDEYKLIIARCARLLALLRGVINVWDEKSEDGVRHNYTSPVIEKPDRINQLFYNLCRGHALICSRNQINKDDLKLIVELAVDSAPTIRARLFRKLLDNEGSIKTNEVEKALQCSKPTALKEMKTLNILGVCDMDTDGFDQSNESEKTITLKDKFEWFLSTECKGIRSVPLSPRQDTMADLL